MAKKKAAGKSSSPSRARPSASRGRAARGGGSPGPKKASRSTARSRVGAKPAAAATRPAKALAVGKPVASARVPVGAVSQQPPLAAPVKPRSSGLSKADLAKFREMLLLKRAELLGDVSRLRDEALSQNRQDAAGNLSSMPLHPADIGSDHYEQEFTLGLIESERAILGEIDEALKRITAGTYGVCAATGRPIGKTRLRAQPWTKYCYEYVLEREKGRTRRY